MADYCTLAEFKADISVDDSLIASSTDMDAVFGSAITEASRLIDRYVGRWDNYFFPSTDTESRYFDGSGEEDLRIDECLSITSLAVSEYGLLSSSDYTTWSSTNYYVYPYNKTPIFELCVDSNGSKFSFPRYRKSILVTGIFGRTLTPPGDVKRACKIQTMRWFMRAKQGYQDAGASPELGQMFYTQELDPDVKVILRPYILENIA